MAKKIKVKPGKTQSKVGFAVGIVFVLIGLIVVIPIFGPFGIFWTAIAGFICFSNFKNGFTNEGMSLYEVTVDDQDSTNDIESRLRKVDDLYQRGLISREEYDRKRKEILDQI